MPISGSASAISSVDAGGVPVSPRPSSRFLWTSGPNPLRSGSSTAIAWDPTATDWNDLGITLSGGENQILNFPSAMTVHIAAYAEIGPGPAFVWGAFLLLSVGNSDPNDFIQESTAGPIRASTNAKFSLTGLHKFEAGDFLEIVGEQDTGLTLGFVFASVSLVQVG